MFLAITALCLTFLITCAISRVFLSVYVYKDLKEIIKMKDDTFSYIFGLSNTLLLSIVLQIAEVDDLWTRYILWYVILWIFIIVMYYLIPYHLIRHFMTKTDRKYQVLNDLFTISGFVVYLLLSNEILYYFKEGDKRFFTFFIKSETLIEFFSLISILFTAILSGYSSMQCIFIYLLYPHCMFKGNIPLT